MIFIILLLFSSFLSSIHTFTRDFRSIAVSFTRVNDEDATISFDSVARSLLTTYEDVCNNIGCFPNNNESIKLLSSYIDTLIDKKLINEINNISYNYWNGITNPLLTISNVKLNSDEKTRNNLIIKQMDIYNLKLGIKLDIYFILKLFLFLFIFLFYGHHYNIY
jgi:hypothetical protein